MDKKHIRKEYTESRSVKSWVYIAALLINVIVFVFIGSVYISSDRSYSRQLFEENVRNVESLNAASANAANTYIHSMGVKIDDLTSYIKTNSLSYEQALIYLGVANTDPDRQLQLVLSGSYGSKGQLAFGDYSGTSVRKERKEDGALNTLATKIKYGTGYYEIFSCFTDVNDEKNNRRCFVKEFTDPDTKQKCFAVYRHFTLTDQVGQKKLYTLLLAINSQTALNACNMQNEYDGQSTVLVNADGDYIIKSSEYRNANFFDYVNNYNGLSPDQKELIQDEIAAKSTMKIPINLYYKNHRGADCVFSVISMETGWYSITCVPLSAFNLENGSLNYSRIIFLLFLMLFIIDGVAIFVIGRIMKYNVLVAERATKNAISANQAKSRFLSTMSHELRTPLNAITGLVSLSNDSIGNPTILKNYLKKIDISSKLLLQLISDILDVSAIESDRIKLNIAEFDIEKLITSLSAIYYDQCAAKGIEFSVSIRSMPASVLTGDSVRLNQVLLNFLSNAVKFTPAGGKVYLRAKQIHKDDKSVLIRFEIEDTGCGISDELRGRLFKPFERAYGETSRKHSGTGLGLSISKSLVELMHGTVGMTSTEGEGSCFWAEIPFGLHAEKSGDGFNPIKNLRVLAVVCDDDEREYIGQLLTGFGVERTLTDKTETAFELLREGSHNGKPYSLCILDWKMPDLTAPDTTRIIRKEYDRETLRIMVLAYDLAGISSRCVDAGADLVFGKPVFPSAFYNTLVEITKDHLEDHLVTDKQIDFSGKRVLLVEDNMLNTEIARLLLTKVGLEVETAENGRIGCDMFVTSAPGYYDVILMDIQMPVMNGYQAATEIRASKHPSAKDIPILAMTADAFADDVERTQKAGMNEHIAKPVIPEALYLILGKYLKK